MLCLKMIPVIVDTVTENGSAGDFEEPEIEFPSCLKVWNMKTLHD